MPRGQSGQAAVEAALTMPLMVFLFLGTLQLFLCYQARLLAVYAASRAASSGARNHAYCRSMNDAAVAALIPSIRAFGKNPALYGQVYGQIYKDMTQGLPYAQFQGTGAFGVGPHDGKSVFWLLRRFGAAVGGPSLAEEEGFDIPGAGDRTIEVRLVFWFPMKIPFANWVLSAMFRAHYGIQDYTAQNPLLMSQKSAWVRGPNTVTLPGAIANELQARAGSGAYACPIVTSWATRMMTPRRDASAACAPAPGGLVIP